MGLRRDVMRPVRHVGTRSYRIRVSGLAPTVSLRGRLPTDAGIDSRRLHTVLVGRFDGHGALVSVLQQLRGHGLEIIDVRRVPERLAAPRPGDAGSRVVVADGTVEVLLTGDTRPALQRALEPYVTALTNLHSLLHSGVGPGRRVELALRLESRGLGIASIAPVGRDVPVPA